MEVHICPIKMRTVKYLDGQCIEECSEEDCLIREEMKRNAMEDATDKD